MRAELRIAGIGGWPRPATAVASAAPRSRAAARPARFDRSAILAAAWRRYRFAYEGEATFHPDLFAAVLEREWAAARFRMEHGAEEAAARREAAARQARQPLPFLGRRPARRLDPEAANPISRP